MNSIKELAELFGYTFTGTCHCDGQLTEKYRNGDYELRWRKHKYQFRVRQGRTLLNNWAPVNGAETFLKSVHSKQAV